MKTNLNTNTYKAITIAELEAMGIKNNFKSHPLCFQKTTLFEIAITKGLIENK